MADMENKIGLPTRLNDQFRLDFGEGVIFDKLSTRNFIDLAPVAEEANIDLSDEPAYFMYRNVRLQKDDSTITERGIRFDLTVIPAGKLGREFIKTSGHYHPKKPGTAYAYPEIYYVIAGQATYLMQKRSGTNVVEDVILSRVKPGGVIVMPPGYGHVTINELAESLVMANWVESNFVSEYADYELLRGAAYYIENNFGLPKIILNENYADVPEIKILKSKPLIREFNPTGPVYGYLANSDLSFLTRPEDYQSELFVDSLFEK